MTHRQHATPSRAERFYRRGHKSWDWAVFEVKHRETDLWIRADRLLEKEAMDAVLSVRRQLENYIATSEGFLASLTPLPYDPAAPPIVRAMLEASAKAGVGPMAAVAGAIAQWTAEALHPLSASVIVENGGDCHLIADEEITVGVYAGPKSPFQGKIALRFGPERFPLAVCTSSGTIGHSLSFGKADAVVVASRSAALADAAATAIGNIARAPSDIQQALDHGARIPGIEGTLILMGGKMGAWGNMELVSP